MRCKNCGWPNKPGATNCSKCNSPLDDTPAAPAPEPAPGNPFPDNGPIFSSDSFDAPQAAPQPARPAAPASQPLGGTVFEGDVFADSPAPRPAARPAAPQPAPKPAAQPAAAQPAPKPAASSPRECPKCGYPLRPDVDKCPNCKSQISGAPAPTPRPAPKPAAQPAAAQPASNPAAGGFTRQATVMGNQPFIKPSAVMGGTINPLTMQQPEPEPAFTLTLQPRDGEVLADKVRDFEGKETVLNRDNLEADNNTITSRRQAVITFEDGKWYVTDNSSLHTTFVRSGNKIEIHSGDTILMGSRMFVFNEKKD